MRLIKNDHYFEIIFGPMFAGKTTELFKRYKVAKRFAPNLKLYRFSFDDRYGEGNASHDNIRFEEEDVEKVTNLENLINLIEFQDPKVVFLEETQFYTPMQKLADYVNDLVYEKKKIVIATALPTTYEGKEFNEIGKLLAIAHKHTKLFAQCTHEDNGNICGKLAPYTQRLSESKELIVVDGAAQYAARCIEHFIRP